MSNENHKADAASDAAETSSPEVSRDRREAVTRLAYMSPVLAGLLFASSPAATQSVIQPPPPPGD